MHTPRIARFLPRLQDIFFASLLGAVLLLGNRMINLDGDLPRHLIAGKYILENLRAPTTELFIYPYENRPYVSHEWLAQATFYAVYSMLGLPGLVLLAAVLLSLTFFIPYTYLAERLSLRLPVLLLVVWGMLVTSLNWAIRPHLFSMFFLSVWLVWADRLRRGENSSIRQFPLLMLLWSNTHGIFIVGILVLLALAAGWVLDRSFERADADPSIGRRIWAALGLSAAASLLNPGGAGSWFSILGFVNNSYLMSRMLEANPPNFRTPAVSVFLLLLVFSIFLLAFKRGGFSAGQGLLLAGFSALALTAFRNVHLYGVAAPFVLAPAFAEFRSAPFIQRTETVLARVEGQIRGRIFPFAALLLIGGGIILSPNAAAYYRFDPETFPVNAVRWLESHPQEGAMFNDLNWGGYLELHLWPRQKAFVDSVADVSGEVTREYETVIFTEEGWDALLEKYDIAWAIIKTDSALAGRLRREMGWEVLYEDETAVILKR